MHSKVSKLCFFCKKKSFWNSWFWLPSGSQRGCEDNLWYSFFYLDGFVYGKGFFCNGVQWYLSCDFFYYALFPFIAVAYGKQKVVGILMVLFCISGSMAHNIWASYVSKEYIAQTYRVFTQWPQDRELDVYIPPWARYHSHGVGVLFGWVLLSQPGSFEGLTILTRPVDPGKVSRSGY